MMPMEKQGKSIIKIFWELWYPQRYDLLWVLGFCVLLILFDRCSISASETDSKTDIKAAGFSLPEIPAVLTNQAERTDYLILHYWDNFDFADTTLVNNADITEQEFVNYINLFPKTTADVVEQSIGAFLGDARGGGQQVFDHFAELFEKYLYDPNSPFRQEDYYIAVLRAIIANEQVDELSKVRPRYQLETALKNRPGDKAIDFEYIVSNGGKSKMSKTTADYLLLFFNNPDCHDCARVKEYLAISPIVNAMMQTNSRPSLRILAVYPDEDTELWRQAQYPANWINVRSEQVRTDGLYDLKAIPTLYLLDKNKRVILKDAPVDVIEQWLIQNTKR